jgi:hypothetical protein
LVKEKTVWDVTHIFRWEVSGGSRVVGQRCGLVRGRGSSYLGLPDLGRIDGKIYYRLYEDVWLCRDFCVMS